MKSRRKLILTLVVSGLATLVLLAVFPRRHVVKVTPGVLSQRVIARAMVVARDGVAEVRPWSNGRIRQVSVQEGDRVTEGQLLADIETEQLEAEVSQREAEHRAIAANVREVTSGPRPEVRAALEAEWRAAKSELALAQDRAARSELLWKTKVVSDADLQEARTSLQVAQARLDVAEARLEEARAGSRSTQIESARERAAAYEAAIRQARSVLRQAQLVAPISGVVLTRRVDPGDVITGAQMGTVPPAFELVDPARLELRVEVEEQDALRVMKGMKVSVRTEGGQTEVGRGVVDRLSEKLERRSASEDDARVRADGRVRAIWVDLVPSLKDGQHFILGHRLEAWIELPEQRSDAVLPRRVVFVREGRPMVEVPGLLWPRPIPVSLGAFDERFVEVRGLPPEQEVVMP